MPVERDVIKDARSVEEKTDLDWRVANNCKENELKDIVMKFVNILFVTVL